VIPCVIALLKAIKHYYRTIDRQLRPAGPIELGRLEPPTVVMPLERWDRLADKALRYALRVSPDVVAIHLTKLEGPDAKEHASRLRRQWHEDVELPARNAGLTPPELIISPSPYRSFVGRLLKEITTIKTGSPGRSIVVVIPELIKEHWWEQILDTGRARRLREALLRHGGPNLTVLIVPWTRDPPHPEKIVEEEEPREEHLVGASR
jgi:hypothetical protein